MLVGRSHECDYPASIGDRRILTSQRTKVASSNAIDRQVRETITAGDSLYELDKEALRDLRPDVILTQDLCEVCSIDLQTVRSIAQTIDPEPRIVSLDPKTIFDVFDDLLTIGKAVGLEERAEAEMVRLRARYWEAIDFVNPYAAGSEVAFLEWTDPPFAGGHWTPGLIQAAGGHHSLNATGEPSREITPEELLESMPDRVIVCPCGFDLERALQERKLLEETTWWKLLPAVQEGNIAVVDGSAMFNRPGPRLVDAFCWLVSWIQDRPEVHPEGFPVRIG
jgi:ABC-type Fe3+-hydroxamate transport system substrate-binding protein